MEKVLTWAASIAAFSVCSTLFHLILPNGQVKKAVEFLLSLCMLMVLLTPFAAIKSSSENTLEFDTNALSDVEQADAASDGCKAVVAESIKQCLKRKGILLRSIQLTGAVDADGYFRLKHIQLVLDDRYKQDEILKILHTELEIPPEIVTVDTQG